MFGLPANDSNQKRGLHRLIAMVEPRQAEIQRTGDGALISFSDGRIVSLTKEPHISENGFMAAVQHWAQRHGAQSLKVEQQ